MKTYKQITQIIQKTQLNEKRNNNIVVVDIQPIYEKYFSFNLEEFTDFLSKQREILYFYNGESIGSGDGPEEIIEMFYEASDYNNDFLNKLENDVIWVDKGYGFFRGWMDEGAEESFIIKAIRLMAARKIWDSREIEPEEWEELFPNDYEDYMEQDCIYFPDISLKTLKKFSSSYIVGGGKSECLKEVQLLMNAFNIRYKEVRKFIY